MILILGAPDEFHSQWIFSQLLEKGYEAAYLNTLAFPGHMKISLTPDNVEAPGQMISVEGQRINLEEVTAVYFRYQMGFQLHPEIPPELRGIAAKEIQSCVGGLYRILPNAKWVNPYQTIDDHTYKVYQLNLMAKAGVPLPKTLISNDPEAVKAFYETCDGNVIYKPVAGGAHTQKLRLEDLTDERLGELSKCPVQFQQMIEGVDVRVYVMGDDYLGAAEIQAKTLDFREDHDAPIVPIELPDEVKEQCQTIRKVLGYEYTGIDVRKTPDGDYIFLEGNPCPMFYYFEQKSGFPITENLLKLLTQK